MSFAMCFILGTIVTIILTILVYVMIMPESKADHLNGFGLFLHNLFHFRKLYIESVIRFFYVISTIGCAALGFFLLFWRGYDFWSGNSVSYWYAGLLVLILGPITIRFVFEITMLRIIEVKNVLEINNKINGKMFKDHFADGNDLAEKFSRMTEEKVADLKREASAVKREVQPEAPAQNAPETENKDPESAE